METKPTSDMIINKDEPIRVLLYGEAGGGKTRICGSFPKPILLFDFDQKLKPLYGLEGIDVVSYTISDPSEYTAVFNQFRRDWKEGKKSDKYKTLVLDSLTSFDIICLRHFVRESGKGALDTATLPVYNDQSGWYSHFFTAMKDITGFHHKNLVITAHEYYNVEKESGIHSIQPLITGKTVLFRLPALFEEVWHLTTKGGENTQRTLHYKKYGKAVATSAVLHGNGKIELPEVDGNYPAYDMIMKHAMKGKQNA